MGTLITVNHIQSVRMYLIASQAVNQMTSHWLFSDCRSNDELRDSLQVMRMYLIAFHQAVNQMTVFRLSVKRRAERFASGRL